MADAVSLCSLCLMALPEGMELCDDHLNTPPVWATENKIACDFFHRRIEPPAPPLEPPPPGADEPSPEGSLSH